MSLYQYSYLFHPVLKSSPYRLQSFPILYQMMLLSQQMRRVQMTDSDWKQAEQRLRRRHSCGRHHCPDTRATRSYHYHRQASATRTTNHCSSIYSWQVLYCYHFLLLWLYRKNRNRLPPVHTAYLWWYRLYCSSCHSLSLW